MSNEFTRKNVVLENFKNDCNKQLQWKGDDMLPKKALEWEQTGGRFRHNTRWTDQQWGEKTQLAREVTKWGVEWQKSLEEKLELSLLPWKIQKEDNTVLGFVRQKQFILWLGRTNCCYLYINTHISDYCHV